MCFVLILPTEPMFAQTSKTVIEQKFGQTQDIDPWDSMRNPQQPADNGQPLTKQEIEEPTPSSCLSLMMIRWLRAQIRRCAKTLL